MKDIKVRVDASFKLDEKGQPKYEVAGGKRHYHIELHTIPEGVPLKSVTYVLDPSYYDWKREVDDPAEAFREEITSYGDYNVTVQAHAPSGMVVQKEALSKLLERHYSSGSGNEFIMEALQTLKKS